MVNVFIVSSSEVVADAVKTSVRERYPLMAIHTISIHDGERLGGGERLVEFQNAVKKMEKVLEAADVAHDRFVGVMDLPHARGVQDIHALMRVEGNLILAFPEVLWVPLYRDAKLFDDEEDGGQDGKERSRTMTLKLAIKLCQAGYSPLFDGDGLRQYLMTSHGKSMNYVRKDIAIAIDEEASFAAINAYTAYRFGYRAFSVMTGECADMLLREGWQKLPVCRKLELKYENEDGRPTVVTFEDVCLEFPDRTQGYLKEIEFGMRRDEEYLLLRDADLRVITTVAQKGERCVDKLIGGMTVERYFAKQNDGNGRKRMRYDTLYGGFWGRQWHYFVRTWFNLTSGGWWGYWLINSLDFCLMTGIVLWVFFKWQIGTIPVLFVLIVARWCVQRWFDRVMARDVRRLSLSPWGRFLLRRFQRPFLPQKFRNHIPPTKMSQHARTYWEMENKPLAGIFGLRNRCGLPNGTEFKGIDDATRIDSLYANVKRSCRFAYGKVEDEGKDQNNHAASGMAMEIASHLLRRAERFRDQVRDVEGAVYGAVLASVATELLDFKTPALSIDALRLKHWYEVMAECEFIGVRKHIDVSDRYTDIHNAMWRICGSETGIVRREVFYSGMLEIVDALMNLLRKRGQLEEAVYMTQQSRFLHRLILPWPTRILLLYPEWTMRSMWNFSASFCGFFLVTYVFVWMHRSLLINPASNGTLLVADLWDNIYETFCILVASQPTMPFDNVDLPLSATIQVLRLIAILHLTFLGVRFWDFMHRR